MKLTNKLKLTNKSIKVLSRLLTAVALLLFVSSGSYWWWMQQTDPQKVFAGAIENNLRTKGLVKTVDQQDSRQGLDQAIAFYANGTRNIFADTIITQNDVGGNQTALVRTETVGTPDKEFFRYAQIDTSQKNEEGESLDFSEVINVWGDKSEQSGQSAGAEVYSEFVFSAIPIEYLSLADRSELINYIFENEVYVPNYDSATISYGTNRPVMRISAELNTEKYIQLLKRFGEIIGQNTYESVDASQYAGQPNIKFSMTIDVLTHRIKSLTFQNGSVDTYTAFGMQKLVDLPSESVPFETIIEGINKAQQ